MIVAVFGGGLGAKPRPAVIVQDDRFNGPTTILAIPFTSGLETASIMRPIIQPDGVNGLDEQSCLMADKLFPVRREMIGQVIGSVSDHDMQRIDIAMQIILGILPADSKAKALEIMKHPRSGEPTGDDK